MDSHYFVEHYTFYDYFKEEKWQKEKHCHKRKKVIILNA